jgi:hypothetical protein
VVLSLPLFSTPSLFLSLSLRSHARALSPLSRLSLSLSLTRACALSTLAPLSHSLSLSRACALSTLAPLFHYSLARCRSLPPASSLTLISSSSYVMTHVSSSSQERWRVSCVNEDYPIKLSRSLSLLPPLTGVLRRSVALRVRGCGR